MALDKLTKVQSVGISSFIQVVGVVTATGGFVGDLTGNVTGNITGTTSNASGATGDFSIADKIVHTGDTNTAIRFPAADTFTVETGGSEAIRVSAGGSFGIATTNPTTPLSVREATNITTYGNVSAQFSDNSTGTLYVQHSSGLVQVGSDTALSFGSGTSADERLRITSDGRLLLGTTNAGGNNTANHLVVSNNAGANDQAGMTIRGGTSGRSQIFFSDGTSGQDEYRGMLRYDHQDNSMQFRTNAVEKVRITSGGNLGVGVVSPTSRLDVVGGGIACSGWSNNNSGASGGMELGWDGAKVVLQSIDRNGGGGFQPILLSGSEIQSSANIKFNNSGNGIDFSANSNASGMTSEVLDDYEEGSWSPGLETSNTNGSYTLYQTQGEYIKIGSMVYFRCFVGLSAIATYGTGWMRVTGLPYAGNAGGWGQYACNVWSNSLTGITAGCEGLVNESGNKIELWVNNNTGSGGRLTPGNLTNNAAFYISGTYHVLGY